MTFRTRTFLVLLTLAALVEAVTFVAVLDTTHDNFVEQGGRELSLGKLVFDNALNRRNQDLSLGVGVLSRDFGFKSAVASGDAVTIRSALINHGSRIDADLGLLVDRDHVIAAASHSGAPLAPGERFPFTHLLNSSRNGDSTMAGVFDLGGRALQLVVAPVFAPDLIGWAAFGFSIDDALASEIFELTNLQVSFVGHAAATPRIIASTLPELARTGLLSATGGSGSLPGVTDIGGKRHLAVRHPLGGAEATGIDVLLSLPMDEVLQGYGALRLELLAVMLAALGLSIVGARLLASAVAEPLGRFAAAARRISQGDYRERVVVSSSDELGTLSDAINDMQAGIEERERQIVHQSRHDALTGLPNRALVAERIRNAVAAAGNGERPFSVLLLDLDGFKAINDTLGHVTGDTVLVEVAKRLVAACRETDTVARLGGDEFLVLLDGAGEALARQFAGRIIDTVGETVPVDAMRIRTRISIGIACFPDHADTPEDIQRRADIAMYAAKESDGQVAVYRPGQDEDHLRRLELVNALREALDDDVLELHYQPKMSLDSGRVDAVEVLARWQHDELGFISPEEFVPLAEQSGLINTLTRTVLDKALDCIAGWRARGAALNLSVNLSALDLLDGQLPAKVAALLDKHALDPGILTLELTESAVMKDTAHALKVMHRLRELGVKLSIDDFGTGHSSLAQLKRLPVDELKIDKSFVMDILTSEDDLTIVHSTIDLGHSMGLCVVAEGVESPEIEELLREFGCDVVQGYHLSRPLPGDQFIDWLAARGPFPSPTSTDDASEADNEPYYSEAAG